MLTFDLDSAINELADVELVGIATAYYEGLKLNDPPPGLRNFHQALVGRIWIEWDRRQNPENPGTEATGASSRDVASAAAALTISELDVTYAALLTSLEGEPPSAEQRAFMVSLLNIVEAERQWRSATVN